ncbi:MAG TPA: OsmC family peroxiredoxin [Solirubrobacterales bacterium]|nr:OsmC family peroxiredoxin [Solirubrobacterales bacterium]
MSIATRTATTTWVDSLASGSGTIHPDSGAFEDLDVTWAARTEAPGGKTSPEELCAAAHSSCFSMALALKLGEAKAPPEELRVTAAVTLDEVDGRPTIASSKLQVEARAKGIDAEAFDAAVAAAADLCPVSRLFAGAEITVDARLLD